MSKHAAPRCHGHLLVGGVLGAYLVASCVLDSAGTKAIETSSSNTTGTGGETTTSFTTQGGAAGQGGGAECMSADQCPQPSSECVRASCENGHCGYAHEPMDKACSEAGGDKCDGQGNCVKSDGVDCSDHAECMSTHCVDGVCCAEKCDGTCEGCNNSGQAGVCVAHAAAADPEGECALGAALCDGARSCADGSHVWSKGFGDAGAFQQGWALTTDKMGNLLATGHFDGTVDFSGNQPLSAVNGVDVFVAKLDSGGNHMWSKSFGTNGDQRSFGVATDGSNNVLITGSFAGNINFGGSTLSSAGQDDIFIAKFDPMGLHQWSKHFGDNKADYGWRVVVDSSDNLVLFGSFENTVNFDGMTVLNSAGGTDLFVTKLTAGGDHIWSKHFGDSDVDSAYDIALDKDGNILITGSFSGQLDFGGVTPLQSAGDIDIYVAKLDQNGGYLWDAAYGSTQEDRSHSVACDSAGNVVLTGYFRGSVDFGGGTLNSSGADMFLLKLDSNGGHLASDKYGGTNTQQGKELVIDSSDNILVIGDYRGLIDLGGGNLQLAKSDDFFVGKLAADFSHLWSHGFGTAGLQIGNGLAVDAQRDVFIAGTFTGNVDFDGNTLTNAGGEDIFMAKYLE